LQIFANYQCHIGPGSQNINHCLARGINENLSSQITQGFVNTCNSYSDFSEMNDCTFFGPHAYGHDAVGGDMSDVMSSPNDPIFHLHHGFINRNWWTWQNANPSRVYAIGGYTRQNCGNNCVPTTLAYELTSFNFYPSVTVDQVMDSQGPYLCYKYDY
jgi:tyrosinase